jgi:hypothetical protein
MTTYRLATEYQRRTLANIGAFWDHGTIGQVEFFYIDETKHKGIQCVWLTSDEVAYRHINSGIETSWRCANIPRGLGYIYTKELCGGQVDE